MNLTIVILVVVGTIGAIDVLYYHLWRFRLYSQPTCVAEEITHLVRSVVFMALLVACAQPATAPWSWIAFGLFAVDIANGAVDTWIEGRSRRALGGLPSGESLVHFLATFGTGLAVASYTWSLGTTPPPLEGLLLWQVRGMLAIGTVLMVIEICLFVRARNAAWQLPIAQPQGEALLR